MLALIPLFPFLGFVVNSTHGQAPGQGRVRRAGVAGDGGLVRRRRDERLEPAAMAPSERAVQETLYTWIAAGDFSVDVAFRLDPLSAVMLLVITGIGSLIHIYSTATCTTSRTASSPATSRT
jgi:NADH-quinone oxidoreductase subunit L